MPDLNKLAQVAGKGFKWLAIFYFAGISIMFLAFLAITLFYLCLLSEIWLFDFFSIEMLIFLGWLKYLFPLLALIYLNASQKTMLKMYIVILLLMSGALYFAPEFNIGAERQEVKNLMAGDFPRFVHECVHENMENPFCSQAKIKIRRMQVQREYQNVTSQSSLSLFNLEKVPTYEAWEKKLQTLCPSQDELCHRYYWLRIYIDLRRLNMYDRANKIWGVTQFDKAFASFFLAGLD